MRLMLGDGAGGFSDQTTTLLPAGAPGTVHGRETIVADFNRDGRADLFFADHGYDAAPFPGAQNSLLLSSGSTALVNATGQLPQLSDYSHSAEAADVDGDGDLDIFVGNGGGGTAYVTPYFLLNNGQGGFTKSDAGLPSALLTGAKPNHWSEAVVDVDGDGDKDLFLGSSTNSGSQLLINDGHGIFTDSGRSLPRGAANADAVDVQVIDFNRDGRPDLIVSYSVGSTNITRQIQLLSNDGAGGFTDATSSSLPASMESGAWVRRVNVADVNGDGLPDLVLNQGGSQVYVADGTGRFIEMPGLTGDNQYDLVTPIDANGDGHVDFVSWRGVFSGAEQFRVELWRDPGVNQTGGADADALMADSRASTIHGGAGADTVVGGTAQDYIRGDEGDDVIYGGDAFDDLQGNMGNDVEYGGRGDDWVVGGKDNDQIYGDEGADVVYGNLGADTCSGGEGVDWVRGGQGDDLLLGDGGDDWLSGDRGSDTMSGGTGADIFHTFSDAGLDRVTDFNAAEGDRVQVDPGTTYALAQVGADTVITMANAQMVLVNVQLNALGQGWIFGA